MAVIVKTTEYCDRCKKEIKNHPLIVNLIKVNIMRMDRRRVRYRVPGEHMWLDEREVDLCKDCVRALDDWINQEDIKA